MSRTLRAVGAVVAGLVLGLVVAHASVGRAAPPGPPCKDGETQTCPLGNGCGGVKVCEKEAWSDCHCAGVPFAGGGNIECESKCDGQMGWGICDEQCNEVVGCSSGTCDTCGELINPGILFCPTGSEDPPKCVAPESCNGCDDDQDGLVDNKPGKSDPLEESCNPNQCTGAGTHYCVDAKWGPCTGCSGTGVCTVCGAQTHYDCSQGCEGLCTRVEQCNQCDDDGDGVLDNGLHCAPCAL